MSDEIKDLETGQEPRQDEWSGTPFQGRTGEENEAVVEEAQEKTGVEEQEATEVQVQAEDEPTVEAEEEKAPAEEPTEAPAEAPTKVEDPMAAQVTRDHTGQPVDYSRTFRSLTEGDVVKGVVVHIDKEGVLVDVGTKSEGIIRPGEISRQSNLSPEEVVQVGEQIDVYVMQSEDGEGSLVLSKKRADFERAWEKVEDTHKVGKTVTAMVTDRVKGGLVVDLGIRGFVPASHVGSGKSKNLDKYIGQSLPLKVIEVDRERRKVVLSHRLAIENEREAQKKETVANLAEAQVRPGVVRRITDYGAFVDLGGIDGLLHISEMSWTRIKHPSEVVRVGDKIQVMILKLDLNQNKISLGLRQILPDPWAEIVAKFNVGDVIKGSVSRMVPFGAFVQVDGGIEGIIPNNELATRRVSKPEEVVSVGQEVEVKIVDLRPEERRMTLSLRQLQVQRDREQRGPEPPSPSYYGREEPKTTIGDLVGDMMREAGRGERRERKRREREVEARLEEEELAEVDVEAPMFEPVSEVEPEVVSSEEPETTPVVEEVVALEAETPMAEEPAAETAEESAPAEPTIEASVEPVATPEEPKAAPKRRKKKEEAEPAAE